MLRKLQDLYNGVWTLTHYPAKTMEEIQQSLLKNKTDLQTLAQEFLQLPLESKSSFSPKEENYYFLINKNTELALLKEQERIIELDAEKSFIINPALLDNDDVTNPYSIKNKLRVIIQPLLTEAKADIDGLTQYQNEILSPKNQLKIYDTAIKILTNLHNAANQIKDEIKWHTYLNISAYQASPAAEEIIDKITKNLIEKSNNQQVFSEPEQRLLERASTEDEIKRELNNSLIKGLKERIKIILAPKVVEFCDQLDNLVNHAVTVLTPLQNKMATQSKKTTSSTGDMLQVLIAKVPAAHSVIIQPPVEAPYALPKSKLAAPPLPPKLTLHEELTAAIAKRYC